MLIGAARTSVAQTLAPLARAAGWRFAGWVATWQHDALVRDVLACEPIAVQIHGAGRVLEPAASQVVTALAAEGWRIAGAGQAPTTRILVASVPGHNHPVAVRLDQHEPPAPAPDYPGDWPRLPAAELAAATVGQLALLPAAARPLRAALALDLLTLVRPLDDTTLAQTGAGLPGWVADTIAAAVASIPGWMRSPSPRRARDLADGQRIVDRLLLEVVP